MEALPAEGVAPSEDAVELQRQCAEYYEQLLRTTAEFDNYRKRVERERQETAQAAAADLLTELLSIVDDLEQALKSEATDEGTEAYRRGVEIIHRQLLHLLRKWDVTPMDTVGTDFDPHYHQAVTHESSPNHRDGEIIKELRRGYNLGTRLLRPAMVKVAKA